MYSILKANYHLFVNINQQVLQAFPTPNFLPSSGLFTRISKAYMAELKHHQNRFDLFISLFEFWSKLGKESQKRIPDQLEINNTLYYLENEAKKIYTRFSDSDSSQEHISLRKVEEWFDTFGQQTQRKLIQGNPKQRSMYEAMVAFWDAFFMLPPGKYPEDLELFDEVWGSFKKKIIHSFTQVH